MSETARAADERFDAILGRYAEQVCQALSEWAATWPPERIIATVIAEHNRRMDEFNRRPGRDQ
jgi:hypothetical protein